MHRNFAMFNTFEDPFDAPFPNEQNKKKPFIFPFSLRARPTLPALPFSLLSTIFILNIRTVDCKHKHFAF